MTALNITFGEKVEAIVDARRDLPFGVLLSHSCQTSAEVDVFCVKVDGQRIHVRRDIKTSTPYIYRVTNMETGKRVDVDYAYDLAWAVDESCRETIAA